MTKHRRCKDCKGRKVVLEEIFDKSKNRFCMIEKPCPTCHGCGYEEVKENNSGECIIYDTD